MPVFSGSQSASTHSAQYHAQSNQYSTDESGSTTDSNSSTDEPTYTQSSIVPCQQYQYDNKNNHRKVDDPSTDDNFGWFDAIADDEDLQLKNNEVRDAWSNRISQIMRSSSFRENEIPSPSCPSSSSSSPAPESPSIISSRSMPNLQDQWPRILFEWTNPNPSISMKLSHADVKSLDSSFGINISSSVSGFRTCQYKDGEIAAEFNFIFCYGSRSYSSWHRYSDFKDLAAMLLSIQETQQFRSLQETASFGESLEAWQLVLSRKKWYRSLSVKYLVEKSIYLGRFMEAVLLESPSPGLLMYFLERKALRPNVGNGRLL